MPPVEDYDELVMRLLESALKRAPEDRKRYLRSVCPSSVVFDDVWMQVEWEQRMGSLLGEPSCTPGGSDPVFPPGTILSNRFEIVREVGRGGMGVVYEAMDQKLDRRVALKCALTPFRSRMPPEARAACEISHFNVCKVHDLHESSTPLGEVEFLSMEYLEGETLSTHIDRVGTMSAVEVRDLGRQICGGLEQLHRQGVIHGDLKCGNIILARSPEGGSRPVITDFGLAKLKTSTDGSGRMSSEGGTFDYMAPELLLGEQISIASDLYALGVVFHIMLTGKAPRQLRMPPVAGAKASLRQKVSNPDATTVTRVADPGIVQGEWARAVVELPSPWKKVVKGCLAPRPSDRFSSATQVKQALEPQPSALRWTFGAFAALAVALVWWQVNVTPSGPPVRLAVLPPVVEGSPIASANGIITDVAHRLPGSRGKFAVISPAEAFRNKVDTPEKAKLVLGATHVLQTRLRNSGTQIVALASISDLASGQVLRDLQGTYSAKDTALLAKALLGTATGAFGLRAGVPQESVSASAYPSYVQGLTLMSRDTRSANEAIPYFGKANEIDPQSALPYAGLAQAQIQNYQRGKGNTWLDLAAANIAKAKSINPDAAPVLVTAGILEQEHGWYEQAARDFVRATELEPNNSEAWRLLASIYTKTDRTEEAIATYQKAINAEPNYYRHYLDFGNFYFIRSEFREAEELQRRVTAVAPNLAEGHMDLGLALLEQGRFPEAENSLLHALRLTRTPQILANVGALYYGEEKFEEALTYFQASIAEGASSPIWFANMGDAFRHLGRKREATDAYRKASTLAEEQLAGNPKLAYVRVLLAEVSACLGNPARAEFELRQALSMEPENALVIRHAVVTYEILEQRQKSLDLLRGVPVQGLEELARSPDAKGLRKDPRFVDLIQKK